MREIVWAEAARGDLRHAALWLADRNPDVARRFVLEVREAVDGLARTPTGRPGRVAGTYEKVLRRFPYIIAYAFDSEGRLAILALVHTSRDWPPDRWPDEDS